MAVITNTNGSTNGGNFVGKSIAVTSLAKTNLTQAELDAAIRHMSSTCTILAIGSPSAAGFETGVTDIVNVLTEGPAPTAESNFGVGATGVTSAVVANWFLD